MGATPWHQDQGVITAEADESDIITVWFPLRDASERHGCLAVAPKSHVDGLVQHCPATRENAAGVESISGNRSSTGAKSCRCR